MSTHDEGIGVDIWHVAIPVRDLESSVEFYCDRLRFVLLGRDEYPSKRQAFVAVAPGGFTIELFEPKGKWKEATPRLPDHLAFECRDIDRYRSLVAASGLDPLEEVEVLDNGVKVFGVVDPDGVPLEFFQGRSIYDASIAGAVSQG